jgi:hypothetical protein
VTGTFEGTATFGSGEENETELTAGTAGNPDTFVAKYDRDGRLLWARQAAGTVSNALGIATDGLGNSYVTGLYVGKAIFGEGEANETELTDAGAETPCPSCRPDVRPADIYLAKFDRNGLLVWATRAGGTSADVVRGIATDGRNSYVTGTIAGTATFGSGEKNETELTAAGAGSNTFVAKYDRNGRLVWAKLAGRTRGIGIATDGLGNSYVTGDFNGTATFGDGENNATELTAAGGGDAFVAKYNRYGRLLWAKQAGSTSNDAGSSIATDGRGNSYVTGRFSDTATFGAGEDNETDLSATGSSGDAFVAKYDRSGLLSWATRVAGTDFAQGTGIATDGPGNSYVTGSFRGTATFGAGEANETDLPAAGRLGDAFVAKYDRNGLLSWATRAGGTDFARGTGIATDGPGNSYVTGYFRGTATFGEGEKKATVLEAGARDGVFVAKYGDRNDEDQCPDSDRSARVVIDGNDTGVENVLTDTEGCTILDLIRQASDDAANRTEFVRRVALLTRTLFRDGLISAEEAGILRTAASQATFPLS